MGKNQYGNLGYEVREKKQNELLKFLLKVNAPIGASTIAEKIGISHQTALIWLLEFAAKGYVTLVEHGFYKFFMPNKDKILKKFEWEIDELEIKER